MKRTIVIEEKVTYNHELTIEFDGDESELEDILSECDGVDHVDVIKIKLRKNGATLIEFDEDGSPDVEIEITDVY